MKTEEEINEEVLKEIENYMRIMEKEDETMIYQEDIDYIKAITKNAIQKVLQSQKQKFIEEIERIIDKKLKYDCYDCSSHLRSPKTILKELKQEVLKVLEEKQ